MFYVKNYTFMKNQNFLLIQNEKKNTISKPFPFPSQRILRLNIVFSFCFLLCLSCADFCHFSDLLDQFICKCAFFILHIQLPPSVDGILILALLPSPR